MVIQVSVNENVAMAHAPRLTSGLVGVQATFDFTEEWTDLVKTCCFSVDGSDPPSVSIPPSNTITIPSEVFAKPTKYAYIGVYGENADGSLAIPTIYVPIGPIEKGASKNRAPVVPPSPDWVANMESRINEALKNTEDILTKAENGQLIKTADTVEDGNMLPVTSNAVYKTVGAIENDLKNI